MHGKTVLGVVLSTRLGSVPARSEAATVRFVCQRPRHTHNQVLVGKVSVGRRDKPGETISDTISCSSRWETIAYFGGQRLSLMSSEWETPSSGGHWAAGSELTTKYRIELTTHTPLYCCDRQQKKIPPYRLFNLCLLSAANSLVLIIDIHTYTSPQTNRKLAATASMRETGELSPELGCCIELQTNVV